MMLIAALLAAAVPAPAAGVTLMSGVDAGARRGETGLWFDPWETGIGFDMPGASAENADAAFALLKEASDTSRSISVRFDPRSGAFDAKRGRFVYRVCTLALDEREVTAREANCASEGSGADPLAEGIALAVAGKSATALAELDRGLASRRAAGERIAGLRWREATLNGEAVRLGPGAQADALLVRALADAREWSRLAPDDPEPALTAAADMTALGAYDAAIAGSSSAGRTRIIARPSASAPSTVSSATIGRRWRLSTD